MALDSAALRGWVGHGVQDPGGHHMGDLIQVLVSGDDVAEWLIVKRGTMTTKNDFVPVRLATVGEHGFTLAFTEDVLHAAPPVADRHRPTAEELTALDDYYGAISTPQ
jgi:hypothetical protein